MTGASKRVGRSIALHFAKEGANVAIHFHHSKEEALDLQNTIEKMGSKAMTVAANLTSPKECKSMRDKTLSHFGSLDVLVNNAANFHHTPFEEKNDKDFESFMASSMATNLMAPIRLAKLFADDLRKKKGVIVNIVDIAGRIAWPEYVAHSAAKAGLEHATRVLATKLAPDIRVNAVMPAIAEFPPDMSKEEQFALVDKTLLKRPGNSNQIAETVFFVSSHDYLTGVTIPVDGGWSVCR